MNKLFTVQKTTDIKLMNLNAGRIFYGANRNIDQIIEK